MVRQICFPAADQIVHDADPKTPVEQKIDHMAADEASAAGHDGDRAAGRHVAPIRFIVRTL